MFLPEENNSQCTEKDFFYNIQFFRFIFAILIVTLHLFTQYYHGHSFWGLFIGVEFFFLLNGFFLAENLQNKKKNEISIKKFIWGKMRKLYPLYLISFFAIMFIIYRYYIISSTVELFMLQGFGHFSLLNSPDWYISSYLISTAIFLGLYKNIKSQNVFLIVTLIPSLIILSYFVFWLKGLEYWHARALWIFNLGTLRGFAEITLGYWLFQIQNAIKGKLPSCNLSLISFSIAEIAVIYYSFKIMFLRIQPNPYVIFQIPLFLLLIFFLTTKKGIISKLLNIKFFNYLGQLSYPIYITHYAFILYLYHHLLNSMVLTKIVFVYGGVLLYAILVNLLISLIKFLINYKKKKCNILPC